MSEPSDHVDPLILADTHAFTWQILQQIDQGW